MTGSTKVPKRWSDVGAGCVRDEGICFLGREREARQIGEKLGKKASMLISGPADIGKTALIKHVVRNLPKDLASKCLYVTGCKDLRDLLRNLLRSLFLAGDPALRRQLRAEGASAGNFGSWLKSAPSSRLKGAIYRAVEHGDYRLIFDHIPPLTYPMARVIKELFWMRDTPVYLLLRDRPEYRIDEFCHFFYWGRSERLALEPLPKEFAGEILERCIKRFRLANFELDKFKEEILELSGCSPGAIVKMCALVADPRYRNGSRIKTKLVRIDYLMNRPRLYPSSMIVTRAPSYKQITKSYLDLSVE